MPTKFDLGNGQRFSRMLLASCLAGVQLAFGNLGGFVTGVYLSPAEVAEFADLIIRGRILRVAPTLWRDAVWTETEIEVVEVWRGAIGDEVIVVRQPGGELEGFKTEAGPRSNFQLGDDWILAVDPIPGSDFHTVIGLIQGAFKVEDGQASRNFSGIRFSTPPPAGSVGQGAVEGFAIERLADMLGGRRGDPASVPKPSPSPVAGELNDTGEVSNLSSGGPAAENGPAAARSERLEFGNGLFDSEPDDGESCGEGCFFVRYPIVMIVLFAGLLVATFFAIKKTEK